MANYYRARQDVSVPRVVDQAEDDGPEVTEGVNYAAGSLIRSSDMTARHRKQAEEGDLDHLLMPISDDDAQNLAVGGGEPEFGIFIAEHEAEAHALEAYGHQVVPTQQALELSSVSNEHAKAYQEAVKNAGYDRRPAQEYFARERERVPAEVLHGAETHSGLPHNRGIPEDAVEASESDGVEESDDSESGAETRPAPGTADSGQGE